MEKKYLAVEYLLQKDFNPNIEGNYSHPFLPSLRARSARQSSISGLLRTSCARNDGLTERAVTIEEIKESKLKTNVSIVNSPPLETSSTKQAMASAFCQTYDNISIFLSVQAQAQAQLQLQTQALSQLEIVTEFNRFVLSKLEKNEISAEEVTTLHHVLGTFYKQEEKNRLLNETVKALSKSLQPETTWKIGHVCVFDHHDYDPAVKKKAREETEIKVIDLSEQQLSFLNPGNISGVFANPSEGICPENKQPVNITNTLQV